MVVWDPVQVTEDKSKALNVTSSDEGNYSISGINFFLDLKQKMKSLVKILREVVMRKMDVRNNSSKRFDTKPVILFTINSRSLSDPRI